MGAALALAAPYVWVLGVAQDAGHPQVGCTRDCCAAAWEDVSKRHMATSIALVDPASGRRWIFDATPSLPDQLHTLDAVAPASAGKVLDGVFLTHAHMGHYTGLVHLGREGLAATGVPVWVMPRMAGVLRGGAPWNLVVSAGHVELRDLTAGVAVDLGGLSVTPILVPHRDEFSETVAFRIEGPNRSLLYLPDIDRWEGFDLDAVLATVDVALLDGTFWADGELVGRDMSKVPHPRVVDTMARLGSLSTERRGEVRFIHLNHTNPLLDPASPQGAAVKAAGFAVAAQGDVIPL